MASRITTEFGSSRKPKQAMTPEGAVADLLHLEALSCPRRKAYPANSTTMKIVRSCSTMLCFRFVKERARVTLSSGREEQASPRNAYR